MVRISRETNVGSSWQELRTRGQAIKSTRPDQDVDTAFDFLDSYSFREE